MDKLWRAHNRIVLLYLLVPSATLLIAFACAKFLHIFPPFWVIGMVWVLCPLLCATIRLKLWKNKDTLLSPEELHEPKARLFFSFSIVEIVFSVLGIGFIFSG